ncbi:hypothetical protein QTA58_22870 [Neorhizobium sp. CSC1952]|uniref:hypothetical protein n=1 Tax=Neorhizobium sp. CSC1952 TaxID=2978974 RepID=UPI0025A5F433|nr:hypothetical protein [Rhizobium sp. CSC1952]WJR66996.1 hypothetical protein QTA58_22870 [Rhizobium sp. CSC1952]
MTQPLPFIWTGEAFQPVNRHWARKCDERFIVGETYTLDEVYVRSSATHAHYFATLHDLWQSLPEHLSEQFPTEEHLRKYALIRTGFHTMTQHACKSAAEAGRLAAAIRPYDTYQLVTVKDSIVTVYHAMSQDYRSMDKKKFQDSKEKVLDWCSALIGAEPEEQGRAA